MDLAADGCEIFYNSHFMILRFCPRVGKLMLPLYLEFGVDIMQRVGRTVYIKTSISNYFIVLKI